MKVLTSIELGSLGFDFAGDRTKIVGAFFQLYRLGFYSLKMGLLDLLNAL